MVVNKDSNIDIKEQVRESKGIHTRYGDTNDTFDTNDTNKSKGL